jgi:hypothetical protein
MKDTIVKILTDERDAARRALSVYGGHISPCPGRPCECGFKQAWDDAQLPATLGSVMDAVVENSLLKRALEFIRDDRIPQSMPASMFADRVLAGSASAKKADAP